MYKPQFHLPRTLTEKEQICQLIEPSKSRSDTKIDSEEREQMAVKSKLEGYIYIKQNNYTQAVIAYNTALDMTASDDLKHKVSLNLCCALYMHGSIARCIEQAELILDKHSDDSKAYLWLALAFRKEERLWKHNKIHEILSDELKEKEAMYGELSYAMGALSLEFSQHDLSVSKSLKNKGIYMFRTKVVSISSEKDLKQAVLESTMNRTLRTTFGIGERHILLVREGIYKLDPET